MKNSKDKKQTVKIAAAIKYDVAQMNAPEMTASGRGVIAEKIIETARQHGIPVQYDPALVQVLAKLKVGSEIPVELYRAVAEILAYVYSINENQRTKNSG